MENGDTYDDPSEDALYLLVEDIAAGECRWVIVEKVTNRAGRTYAHLLHLADRTFQVERRRGSPDTHEIASPLAEREAHRLLTRWAFGL